MISIFPLVIWTLMLFNSLSPDTAWNPFFLKREEACGQQGTDVHDPSLSLPSRISEQAVPHLRGSTRCTPSLPRQGGSAESHRRARPCARRRAGGGGGGGKPGGRGSAEIRGSTPCKTNCPCTSADGVERGQGARHRVDRRRCRTAAAECTAGCPREPRRVTRMPSSTDTIRLKQSRFGWFLGAFPTCGAPPSRKPCRGDQRSRAEGSPRSCARSDECRCSPAPTRNSCPLPCPACGNSCRDWPG